MARVDVNTMRARPIEIRTHIFRKVDNADLEHGELGGINQIAKQGKRALKDTAGGSLGFGIVDDGSGGDSLAGGRGWEGEEEERDEHCHPVKLFSAVGFYMEGVGLAGV